MVKIDFFRTDLDKASVHYRRLPFFVWILSNMVIQGFGMWKVSKRALLAGRAHSGTKTFWNTRKLFHGVLLSRPTSPSAYLHVLSRQRPEEKESAEKLRLIGSPTWMPLMFQEQAIAAILTSVKMRPWNVVSDAAGPVLWNIFF